MVRHKSTDHQLLIKLSQVVMHRKWIRWIPRHLRGEIYEWGIIEDSEVIAKCRTEEYAKLICMCHNFFPGVLAHIDRLMQRFGAGGLRMR